MSRIDDIFADLRQRGARGLMPFISGGYPDCITTTTCLRTFADAGAAITEVGIPFSDSIADGPTIANAMHDTLEAGVQVDDVLEAVTAARSDTDMGLVAMVSASIVHRRGNDAFLQVLSEAGFDGVIIPDIDPDQAVPLVTKADALDMSFSLLIAPTTPPGRIGSLVAACRGFVYLLARAGLTGATSDLPDVANLACAVRQATDLPIAAGFGIGTARQVAAATAHCDAAIVGSALVKTMAESGTPAEAARDFVRTLASGLHLKD